jgi:hypothetical protein
MLVILKRDKEMHEHPKNLFLCYLETLIISNQHAFSQQPKDFILTLRRAANHF